MVGERQTSYSELLPPRASRRISFGIPVLEVEAARAGFRQDPDRGSGRDWGYGNPRLRVSRYDPGTVGTYPEELERGSGETESRRGVSAMDAAVGTDGGAYIAP